MILLYFILLIQIGLFAGQIYIVYKMGRLVIAEHLPTQELEKAVIYHESKIIELEARIESLEKKVQPPVLVKPEIQKVTIEKPNTDWMRKYE